MKIKQIKSWIIRKMFCDIHGIQAEKLRYALFFTLRDPPFGTSDKIWTSFHESIKIDEKSHRMCSWMHLGLLKILLYFFSSFIYLNWKQMQRQFHPLNIEQRTVRRSSSGDEG